MCEMDTPFTEPSRTTEHPTAAEANPQGTISSARPSLKDLPFDVILKVVSYLPKLPPLLVSVHLKEAYHHLSLARVHHRYAAVSFLQTERVRAIDPCPYTPHVNVTTHLPPYANPPFLGFLVSLCPNLTTLRAPRVRDVLHFAGNCLQDLSFYDIGLTIADLRYLSRSRLHRVTITNPSQLTLAALSSIEALNVVSLNSVSERVVPKLLSFFSCTAAHSLFLEVDFTSDEPLLALLHGLPPLRHFVLKCQVPQLWWALRYLRRVAMKVRNVELIVGGVRILVKKLNERDKNSHIWETSIMRRLLCRKDLGANELDPGWPANMSFREINFEQIEEASGRGVRQTDIVVLLSTYYDSDLSEEFWQGITVHFGRDISTVLYADQVLRSVVSAEVVGFVTRLIITQDIVLFAQIDCQYWRHKLLAEIFHSFPKLLSVQLCKPSKERRVSARFVMALPNFLRFAVSCCRALKCVYLEDAGELVLQTAGLPVLTDETKLRELLSSVIADVKKLEADKRVEMGTVIGQLETWAREPLRVARGKGLDDAVFLLS